MKSAQGDQHGQKKGGSRQCTKGHLQDFLGDNPEEWLENPVYDIIGVVAEG